MSLWMLRLDCGSGHRMGSEEAPKVPIPRSGTATVWSSVGGGGPGSVLGAQLQRERPADPTARDATCWGSWGLGTPRCFLWTWFEFPFQGPLMPKLGG